MAFGGFSRHLGALFISCTIGCGGGTTTNHDAGAEGGHAGHSGTGGSGAGSQHCVGLCAPGQPNGFDYAALVWFGPKSDAPGCPADAASLAYEGYADLDAPIDCGTCTCELPTGSCRLPESMTANAAACAQNGTSTPHTPFDPSAGWDGTCDTNQSIPSGKLCSGIKCVQSLSIGALGVNEVGCVPSQPPMQSPPVWKSFVRACRRVPHEPCGTSTGVCTAEPPVGSGFRVCVFTKGDYDCPSFSPYSEKHVLYDAYEDTRSCSSCMCGAPTGGSCSSTISIYADGACSTPVYTTTVTSAGPNCHDVPAGTPLGSKSATPPTYAPGACAPSGGEPQGAATPTHPSTYCCLPEI